jgi:small subunit ribosomal protein S3
MGQKTHLVGIRLGINRRSCSYWYAEGVKYTFFVEEDRHIRQYVFQTLSKYIVSRVDIERRGSGIRLRISTAKAGENVGSVEKLLENWCSELRTKCSSVRSDYFWKFSSLKTLTDVVKEPDICVFVRQLTCPESNAHFLANFLVTELEKRTPFRQAIRMVQERRQNIGQVRGFRVQVSGRLNGVEIARTEWSRVGRVPLHTLVADLDYSCKTARTIYGLIGVKTWVFKPANVSSFYFTVLKFSCILYDTSKA